MVGSGPISNSFETRLRENPSVGQNRQISEMSGEFCQLAGQYVQQKINPEKCPDTVFGLLDLQ